MTAHEIYRYNILHMTEEIHVSWDAMKGFVIVFSQQASENMVLTHRALT